MIGSIFFYLCTYFDYFKQNTYKVKSKIKKWEQICSVFRCMPNLNRAIYGHTKHKTADDDAQGRQKTVNNVGKVGH